MCASMSGDRHYRQEENIAGAIENVILQLAYHGKALFEIVVDPESSALALSSFSPEYVWNLPFYYLQIAPPQSWQELDRKYVFFEKGNVWRVDMPGELGGVRGFRRILKTMAAWHSLGPRFYQDDLKNRQMPQEFIFKDYRRANQVELYRVTADWGWNGRDWRLDDITEYYQFHRHITFKWAQAKLREHVVKELNSLLARVGISAKIVMEGLSTSEDILNIREKMREGILDFSAAVKEIQ